MSANLFKSIPTEIDPELGFTSPDIVREHVDLEIEEKIENAGNTYPRYGYSTADRFENEEEYREWLEAIADEEMAEYAELYDDAIEQMQDELELDVADGQNPFADNSTLPFDWATEDLDVEFLAEQDATEFCTNHAKLSGLEYTDEDLAEFIEAVAARIERAKAELSE